MSDFVFPGLASSIVPKHSTNLSLENITDDSFTIDPVSFQSSAASCFFLFLSGPGRLIRAVATALVFPVTR